MDNSFKWYLDVKTDTNGNKVEYNYSRFSDSLGQLDLSKIRYSLSETAFHSVVIDYESRSDSFEDYRSGFLIKTGRRASKISVKNTPFVDLSMQSSALWIWMV